MVVKTEPIYRAKVSNGVILENDRPNFAALYRGAVRELKGTYGHSVYFECGYADVSYGILTTVYQGSKCRSSYIELKKICHIDCFSIDRKTYIKIRKEGE